MSKNHMDALTEALVGAPSGAGLGIENLCKVSALKAVHEVLDALLGGAQRDPMTGYIKLPYTTISERVIEDAVRRAIDKCCD